MMIYSTLTGKNLFVNKRFITENFHCFKECKHYVSI